MSNSKLLNFKKLMDSVKNMKIAIVVFIFPFNLFLLNFSHAGEIRTFIGSICHYPATGIELNGELIPGDTEKLKSSIRDIQRKFPTNRCKNGILTIALNSTGGSVSEAIKLGDLIRNEEAATWVLQNGKCYSSCVYTFAGGIRRVNLGKIGIHRPYFSQLESNVSVDQIRAQRDNLNIQIRDYLRRMDVSIAVLDESLGIEPERIKLLSKLELERYRLTGEDPSFDERETAKVAAFYNMTSSEYRSRKSSAVSQCQHLAFSKIDYEYIDCSDGKLLRISMNEAARRRIRASNICTGLNDTARIDCRRNVLVNGN